MPKIFGIGMFKTGLTSLGEALANLGYSCSPGEWYHGKIFDDPWAVDAPASRRDLLVLHAHAQEFDVHIDYPWMFRFREMSTAFPDARFILTVRKPENVARSNRNHRRSRGTTEADLPSEERIIRRYLDHGRMVSDHFQGKQNLLIMNIEDGDGWEPLCKFLKKPIPDAPFPWTNRGIYA
jgi:hypothetical protein